jgi:hypothetical protein
MPEKSDENQESFTVPETWSGFLFLLITTKQGWLGITGVAAIVTAAMLIAMQFIRPEKIIVPEKIDISTAVGSISIKNGNTQNAFFLLSPSGGDGTPWVKTGITVKKGDVIKITASGRVNTAIKRVVAQTVRPEIEETTWADPSGLEREKNPEYPPQLEQSKVLPGYEFGMLLAAVAVPRAVKDPQEVQDSSEKVEIDHIAPFVQDKDGESIEFTAKNDGELVLTVNDLWLSPTKEDTYAPPFEDNRNYYLNVANLDAALRDEDFKSWSEKTKRQKAEEQYQKRVQSWEDIVAENKWNIWYEDNVGSFSVSIAVNPK